MGPDLQEREKVVIFDPNEELDTGHPEFGGSRDNEAADASRNNSPNFWGWWRRGSLELAFTYGYSPKTATCERMVAFDGRLGALDVNTPRAGAFGEVRVVVQPATTSGCPGRCRFGCRQGSGGDCCAGSSCGRVPR